MTVSDPVQKQGTLLVMLSCPLSLRERVRVRGFNETLGTLTPRPLPEGEGARSPICHAQKGLWNMH